MNEKLCNVAVAVPLRTTFTYRIPERFAADNDGPPTAEPKVKYGQ